MSNGQWIAFLARLPTARDANAQGMVEASEPGGATRPVMWNWVNSAALWNSNGFVYWRSIPDAREYPRIPMGDGSNTPDESDERGALAA